MKISIIIVCYNAKKTIEDAILSIIQQTYANLELIIIDGKSTDGTIEIIKKYEKNISFWVSEPDSGIYNAMNKGLHYASGDYVYFLGADDQLKPNIIQEISTVLTKPQIYYGNIYMRKRMKTYAGKFNSFMLVVKNIPHQATFYPKRIYKTTQYNEKYKLLADYNLNLELWKKENFIYIPYTIAIYNDEGASSTYKDTEFEKNRFQILCTNLPIYCFPYIVFRKIRTLLGNFLKSR